MCSWRRTEPRKTPRRRSDKRIWLGILMLCMCTPGSAQSPGITDYPIPTGRVSQCIAPGPDGALWFTEAGRIIGRISTGGIVTEYALPGLGIGPLESMGCITTGPDGALWFAESDSNKIGRITTGGVITEYSLPQVSGGSSKPYGITAGPDNTVWFTELIGNKIGRITTTGVTTEFVVPTANSGPGGITMGPDGALWFTEFFGNQIGRITTGGNITEFAVPVANGMPREIAPGPDGALWFTDDMDVFVGRTASIGRITVTGDIKVYEVPSTLNTFLYHITTGPDGALWFADGDDKIGRITIGGTITEYPVPTAGSIPQGVALGSDGRIWYAGAGKIERVTIGVGFTNAGSAAHLASGGTWETTITLVNTGSTAAQARLNFFDDMGNPLTLPLTFPQSPIGPLLASTIDRTLGASAEIVIKSAASGTAPIVGWAQLLTSSGNVSGVIVLRQSTGASDQQAGVPFETRNVTAYLLPFDNTGSFVTAVALANTSLLPSTIGITIRDDSGAVLLSNTISLVGQGHTAFLLPTSYGVAAGTRGTVEFNAPTGGQISVLSLQYNNATGAFSNNPILTK